MSGCRARRMFAFRKANVCAKGRRPLVLACDMVTKLSASHRGVRTSEGVDLWALRAMGIAVEMSSTDVPDNRPLSDRVVGRPWCDLHC
jgi:hypothetical protein